MIKMKNQALKKKKKTTLNETTNIKMWSKHSKGNVYLDVT